MKKTKSKNNKKLHSGRKAYICLREIDKLYKIINKVQIDKELTYIFFSDQSNNSVAENILKDAEIKYEIIPSPNKVVYKLIPSKEEKINLSIDIDFEFFNDEIPEEGQVF